jgi:hypothetical protein
VQWYAGLGRDEGSSDGDGCAEAERTINGHSRPQCHAAADRHGDDHSFADRYADGHRDGYTRANQYADVNSHRDPHTDRDSNHHTHAYTRVYPSAATGLGSVCRATGRYAL